MATLTIKHLETGLSRSVVADVNGNYTIPSLPAGTYEVTAEKIGFRREVRRGIDLAVALTKLQEPAVCGPDVR